MTAIAKRDRNTGETRSLIGHCLDVALAAERLIGDPVMLTRLETACQQPLDATQRARLVLLAGLHDCGKALVGFQRRITGQGRGTSHLAEALAALMAHPGVQQALRVPLLTTWFSDPAAALFCAICHHGSPVARAAISTALSQVPSQVQDSTDYAPLQELAELSAELLRRFPQAQAQAPAIHWTASFDHLFAGMVMLADWLGSSLPISGADWRPREIQDLIATLPWSGWHSGKPAASILPWPPLGAQGVIGAVPLASRLVVVEAPTGTGKTETALLHALRLVAAGEVDGLYFALPTRAAATEIHERIAWMARAHSPALAGRVVRAVPGLLDTDPWQRDLSSWAIASPKRVMAAPIAVGTIDQAMLSALRTRHAWMRHAALSRLLLVIDEVHASDPYMLEIVRALVRRHLAVGGHALLMSATLGEVLRAELEQRPRLDLAQALIQPYPAVNGLIVTAPAVASALRLLDADAALAAATDCVTQGGCALIIRSTVNSARQTFQHLQGAGMPAMLHHSRYADVDRQYLDAQLVGILGKGGHRTPLAIVATQTAEQSLDIDADLLVTDPAPGDVLLQRRGRLGRHRLDQILPLIVIAAANPAETVAAKLRLVQGHRARMPPGSDWAYVYDVLATLATLEALGDKDHLRVPDDVRWLVETATHPESLEAFAYRHGWEALWQHTWGNRLAQRQVAASGLIDWTRPYEGQTVDDAIPTRLGDPTVTVTLNMPLASPFTGAAIAALPVPGRWLKGVAPGTQGKVSSDGPGRWRVNVGQVQLNYDQYGLEWVT
jgi:CRISPR-associated endonuclease/helicase Cas3